MNPACASRSPRSCGEISSPGAIDRPTLEPCARIDSEPRKQRARRRDDEPGVTGSPGRAARGRARTPLRDAASGRGTDRPPVTDSGSTDPAAAAFGEAVERSTGRTGRPPSPARRLRPSGRRGRRPRPGRRPRRETPAPAASGRSVAVSTRSQPARWSAADFSSERNASDERGACDHAGLPADCGSGSFDDRDGRPTLLDRARDTTRPPRASTVSRPTIASAAQSAPLTSTSGCTCSMIARRRLARRRSRRRRHTRAPRAARRARARA